MQIDDDPLDAKKITINLCWGWGSLLLKIAWAPDISQATHKIRPFPPPKLFKTMLRKQASC